MPINIVLKFEKIYPLEQKFFFRQDNYEDFHVHFQGHDEGFRAKPSYCAYKHCKIE